MKIIPKMNEIITINEVKNDGSYIHLYFNAWLGLYVAYGVSAYLMSKQTEVSPSYSEDMQMPVVVINVAHYDLLKQQLEVLKKDNNYRCLKSDIPYDDDDYTAWASEIRGGLQSIG